MRLDRHWRFDANLAYTDAHYGAGFQSSPGVDASFKQVPDVPGMTANLWGVWSHPRDLPIEFGVDMQYVSARKGNYTNTLTLNDYALVNIYAAWDVYKNIRLYGRIDNLGDKRFVQWADTSYPSEVIIGTPRTFSFNMQAQF
ncbi:MAG: TonB-dependent receptor [Acetobacteraceae bacterium]